MASVSHLLCYSGAFKWSPDDKSDQVAASTGCVHSGRWCGWSCLSRRAWHYIIPALVAFWFDSEQAAQGSRWVSPSPAVDSGWEPGQVPGLLRSPCGSKWGTGQVQDGGYTNDGGALASPSHANCRCDLMLFTNLTHISGRHYQRTRDVT